MRRPSRARARWFLVVVFAIGMAWVEAASVYYLRVMVDRIDPYQKNPLPIRGVLGQVELVREAGAEVAMLESAPIEARDYDRAEWDYEFDDQGMRPNTSTSPSRSSARARNRRDSTVPIEICSTSAICW